MLRTWVQRVSQWHKVRTAIADTVRRPSRLFEAAFTLFVVAGFVLGPKPVWAMLFYALVVPSLAWMFYRERPRLPSTAAAWLMLILVLYFTVTIAWGVEQERGAIVKYARAGVANGIFLLAALCFFFRAEDRVVDRMLSALLVLGALNAAISLAIYGIAGDPTARLHGFAETRHPILGGLIIGSVCVIALSRLDDRGRRKGLLWLAIFLTVAFVLLTRSRAAMAALAAGALTVMLFLRWRTIFALIVGALVMGFAAYAVFPDTIEFWFDNLMLRADSHRFMIWSYTLDKIREHPTLGHGLAASIGLPAPFSHPHSVYISAAFYGGAVGLALLAGLFGSLAAGLYRGRNHRRRILLTSLWVYMVVSGLFDLSQPLRSPSELWYIIWLPASLIASQTAVSLGTNGASDSRLMHRPPDNSTVSEMPDTRR